MDSKKAKALALIEKFKAEAAAKKATSISVSTPRPHLYKCVAYIPRASMKL